MVNIKIMEERLAEIDSEFRSLDAEAGESRLSDEQQTRWDALDTEKAEIAANIEQAKADEARAQRVAESRARWGSVQVAPSHNADAFDLSGLRGLSGDAMVERARSAFDPAFSRRGASEAAGEVLRKIEMFAAREDDDAEKLARYALVHGSDAYRSAFRSWMQAAAKGNAPVLSQAEADAVRASMSLTSANGGYALPTLLDPTLIETGAMTKNPIRRISRIESGMADKWNGVTVGNVTTYWKAEASAFTEGGPTTGTVQVDAAMLTAYVTGSYEIFQDSNLQAQLPGLIGKAIDMAEGVAFVSGSGSDAPKGIVTAISATVASTVTATTRGAFTAASTADTLALFNALPSRYEDTATWVMNKATYLTIAQQTYGTAGGKVIDMLNRNVILDLPVERASTLPAATTSGNILSVLGDFSEFIIYDRLGVNVEFIQNVVDGSGLPTGQRGLVAYKRVGSDVADVNAFRFLKA
jgi:HK97 family phage major capsid protein